MTYRLIPLIATLFIGSCDSNELGNMIVLNPVKVPAFKVEVTLTPDTERFLKEKNESIITSTWFYGYPKKGFESKAYHDGRITVGNDTYESFSPGIHEFTELTINGDRLGWLDEDGYYLNINVFSGRKSSKNNYLDCGFYENTIAIAVQKTIKLNCHLIGSKPANTVSQQGQ